MTNLNRLAERLRKRTEWQQLPRALEPSEYVEFIIYGIQQFFILTSDPGNYSDDKITIDETEDTYYSDTFSIDETEYI